MKIFYRCFIILILMFSSWLPSAAAQEDPAAVWMPDANLRAEVREALGLGPNAALTQQGLRELGVLISDDSGITDLTGLEHAANLEILSLGDNQISNLAPLAALTNLENLHLSDNQISNLAPLAALTNLRYLSLIGNQISNLAPLAGLTNLQYLYLSDNQISNLAPLAGLTNLQYLYLIGNQISNLAPLAALTNLRYLYLSDNPIADRSQIAALSSDIELDVPRVYLHTPIYFGSNISNIDGERRGHIYRADHKEISLVISFPGSYINGIALDLSAGKIYATTDDRTWRVNLDGSNLEDLEVGGGYAIALDTSRGKMYLLDERWEWTIKRANLDGSNVEDIVPGLSGESGLAESGLALDVSAGKIYWADRSRDRIQRANLDGTGVEDVVTRLGSPQGSIALDLGRRKIYWTETSHQIGIGDQILLGRVRCANLDDGSNVETIVSELGFPKSIAIDTVDRKVYWIEGKLRRANLDGSLVEDVGDVSEYLTTIAVGQVAHSAPAVVRSRTPSPVAQSQIVFNEIYNAPQDKDDWIELKNITDTAISLTDWEITLGEQAGEDTDIITFPIDYTLPPKGILLVVNTPPSHTDLIRGQDITKTDRNLDAPPQYLIAPELRLPHAPYLLILRSARDKNGTPEALEDIAGNYFRATVAENTQVWPLHDTSAPLDTPATLTQGKAWKRVSTEKRGYAAGAWTESGYQAGIGYRPGVSPQKGLGTPGYANDAVMNDGSAAGQVSFSEVMFTSEGGLRSLSQWMELYNNSYTTAVNLKGWSLEIEVRDADGSHRHGKVALNDLTLLPNQTVLIVTWAGRNSDNFPEGSVYNFFRHHSDAFEQDEHRNQVLSAAGFSVKLSDADGTLVDTIGNLDGDSRTEDVPLWALPLGETEEGVRRSVIRRYDVRLPSDGTLAKSWWVASEVSLKVGTYWGRETDVGTPGYRDGGILPVGLSSFRSERTELGVAVRWTTASETDNAGFNILRGESRKGEFVRIHPTLIQGSGTTSEAHHYEWLDVTARPDVVYYYRLEDVSFSGDRRVLGVVRLRGHISAVGKEPAVWGAVKSRE